jgi:membrane protein implicated in regulation of membrane protease activity
MESATIWWILAGVLVGLELLTGTFYLLMFALGLAAAAVCAHAGFGLVSQILIGALVGGGAVAAWHFKQSKNKTTGGSVNSNADVHIDIGSVVQVENWPASGAALVLHRGASWSARLITRDLQADASRKAGAHRIVAVEGNTLVLEPITT